VHPKVRSFEPDESFKKKISADTDVYDEACRVLDRVIGEAFGIEWPEEGSPEQWTIKHADHQALLMEAARLLPDGGEALRMDRRFEEKEFRDLAALEVPLVPGEAEKLFLEAHADLTTHDR